MIHFFGDTSDKVYAVQSRNDLTSNEIAKLSWLFGNQPYLDQQIILKQFVGPRAAMITPWSTNAVEICVNMGIIDLVRIEQFVSFDPEATFDPMLSEKYEGLDQHSFTINIRPAKVLEVVDIAAFNMTGRGSL